MDQHHHCNWFKRFGLNYHHGGIITPVHTLTGFAKLTMEAVASDEKTQRTNRANSVWNVFENQFSHQESQHSRHQDRQHKVDGTRHQYSSIKHEFDSKHLNKIEEGVKRMTSNTRMQCKQSYPDLPRMPPSQKQKISSVQESNEEEDESLEALANNGSMMEGKITNKVRMQHAKTQTEAIELHTPRTRRTMRDLELKNPGTPYIISPIKRSTNKNDNLKKTWTRTPCVICGNEGHVLYTCPRRAKKRRQRDVDYQVKLDSKQCERQKWKRRQGRMHMLQLSKPRTRLNDSKRQLNPEFKKTVTRFKRRREKNRKLKSKKSITDKVISFYHIPIAPLVDVTRNRPLSAPLLLRKVKAPERYDSVRAFEVDRPNVESLKWKASVHASNKAMDKMKRSRWNDRKRESQRKRASIFAKLNDEDHVLLGTCRENLEKKMKRKNIKRRPGAKDRLPNKKSFAALASSDIKYPTGYYGSG